jgi:hypothetical protein
VLAFNVLTSVGYGMLAFAQTDRPSAIRSAWREAGRERTRDWRPRPGASVLSAIAITDGREVGAMDARVLEASSVVLVVK